MVADAAGDVSKATHVALTRSVAGWNSGDWRRRQGQVAEMLGCCTLCCIASIAAADFVRWGEMTRQASITSDVRAPCGGCPKSRRHTTYSPSAGCHEAPPS